MSLLTRDALRNGVLQQLLRERDDVRVLEPEELARSRAQILKGRPASGEVWLFAYGSLIWNPAFHFAERRLGRIIGWHRRFCLWTHLGRGTPDCPGLTLGLERGGSCAGLVYRIAEDAVDEELEIVWCREMVTAAYRPTWVVVRTDVGAVPAIAFVIDRRHDRYTGQLRDEVVVDALARAEGPLGACADYLFQTTQHLTELGIRDPYLERLVPAVHERRNATAPPVEAAPTAAG